MWVYRFHAWEGEPQDTKEMIWGWHPLTRIPYEGMWDADQYWLPKVLAGEKFEATVRFKDDEKTVNEPEFTALEHEQ